MFTTFKLVTDDNSNPRFEATVQHYSCLTWNIEGFSSSKYTLKHMLQLYQLDLIFLSEPLMYQCDLTRETSIFNGEYCSSLSSDDLTDYELPLARSRPKGGTMIMWRYNLDSYIKTLNPPSSNILPVLFSPPGSMPSLHISIYLPTAGKDSEFIEQISCLHNFLSMTRTQFPGSPIFIRGDSNANPKNKLRGNSLSKLCSDFDLKRVKLNHSTYHHFLGGGLSDSEIDVLLHSSAVSETLTRILCTQNDPTMASHHDAVFSECNIPCLTVNNPAKGPVTAPRVSNSRVKIHWSPEGVHDYSACIEPLLSQLRSRWANPSSTASMSILLQTTNSLLDLCAKSTNKFSRLSTQHKP